MGLELESKWNTALSAASVACLKFWLLDYCFNWFALCSDMQSPLCLTDISLVVGARNSGLWIYSFLFLKQAFLKQNVWNVAGLPPRFETWGNMILPCQCLQVFCLFFCSFVCWGFGCYLDVFLVLETLPVFIIQYHNVRFTCAERSSALSWPQCLTTNGNKHASYMWWSASVQGNICLVLDISICQ